MKSVEIKELLLKNFPSYAQKKILLDDLTKRINDLPEEYKRPLIEWLKGGDVPVFSCSGYSVAGLVLKGFTVPSAVLTIAWLEYAPNTALQVLKKAGIDKG